MCLVPDIITHMSLFIYVTFEHWMHILCYCCGVCMVIAIFIMYICIIRYLYLSAGKTFAAFSWVVWWFMKWCSPADDFHCIEFPWCFAVFGLALGMTVGIIKPFAVPKVLFQRPVEELSRCLFGCLWVLRALIYLYSFANCCFCSYF